MANLSKEYGYVQVTVILNPANPGDEAIIDMLQDMKKQGVSWSAIGKTALALLLLKTEQEVTND